MQRNPPGLKQALRQAQGFVCAFPGCSNPYLSFHHFDPPWHEQQHNDPDGMIGLCGEHHPKADAGAFTKEQLHAFKRRAAAEAPEVKGQFDWLRKSIAVEAGGILFVDNGIDIAINGRPAVWFNRDSEGYAMLNVVLPARTGEREVITDNSWMALGDIEDLESPPGGKSLKVSFGNGDRLLVEFGETDDFTVVTVAMSVPDLGFSVHSGGVGAAKISGSRIERCGIGLAWNWR